MVDNLPCATRYQHVDTHAVIYEHGYRLGLSTKDSGDLFLNNHIILKLHYHKETEYEHDDDQLVEKDMNLIVVISIESLVLKLNQRVLIPNVLKSKRMDPVRLKMGKIYRKLPLKVSERIVFIESPQSCHLGENKITMTYEVEWTPSETRWASRYVQIEETRCNRSFVFRCLVGTHI